MWRLGLALGLLLGAAPAWADFPLARGAAIYMVGVNTTTHPIPNPVATKVGDLILVHATFDGFNTYTWPSSSYLVGNAWSVCQAHTVDADSAHSSEIRYGVLDAVMSGTENLTTQSESGAMIVLVVVAGSFSGSPVCNTNATSSPVGAPNTAIDPPNLTSGFGAVDTGWIVTASADAGQSVRVPIALTVFDYPTLIGANLNDTDGTGNAMAFRNLNAAALDPPTNLLVIATAEQWLANVIAVQGQALPSSSGGGGPPAIIGAGFWPGPGALWATGLLSLGVLAARCRRPRA